MNIQTFFRPGEKLCEEPLHYTDSGLDNIYLQNGFTWADEDGERYLTVTDIDGLHKAIGLHIVLARKAPSGRELRFLRNELKMSQAELARVLSVSDQSVARWEKGKVEANGGAVLALRMVYVLSLVPGKERVKIMDGILERFRKLAEADETSDDIVLCYQDNKWKDPSLLAA